MKTKNAIFGNTLETATRSALAHLENLDCLPVAATASLDSLRSRLGRALTDESIAPEQVVSELVRDVDGGIVGSAGGRFFGWVIGGSLPAALAADWLAAAWDQNACLYAAGPAAAIVEEVAGRWLKEILGLPARASFAMVTGCQMAHVTCLAAARHAVLAGRGWDVEQRGLYGGFFTFQQQLTRNASENPEGGLKVFVNGVFADTATATTDQQFAAGLQYTGPISWRPNDVIAFAAGTTHVNNRVTAVQSLQNSLGLGPVPVKNSEYVFELYYQVVPTAGLLFRPNVQYIYSPGGSSQTKDVWVLGLKTVIRF